MKKRKQRRKVLPLFDTCPSESPDDVDDTSFDLLSAELAQSLRRKRQLSSESDSVTGSIGDIGDAEDEHSLVRLQLEMGRELSGQYDHNGQNSMVDPMFSGWGLRNPSDLTGLGVLPPDDADLIHNKGNDLLLEGRDSLDVAGIGFAGDSENDAASASSSVYDHDVWKDEDVGPPRARSDNASDPESAAPFPTLNKIGGRFARSLSRRLRSLTECEWTVVPISARQLTIGEALQTVSGFGMSVEIAPLAGEAMVVADDRLCRLLGLAMLEGSQPALLEDSPDLDVLRSTTVRELVSYVLQVVLLDFEWAITPYYEVESSRKHTLTIRNGVARSCNRQKKARKQFGNKLFRPDRSSAADEYTMTAPDTSCIAMRLFVLSGAEGGENSHGFGVPVTGTLQILFPLDMVEPLLEIFKIDGVLLAPDDTETDDDLYLRLRLMPDERLAELVARNHPLMGAVVLQRFGERRRERILALLEPDAREEMIRRMGRRATLTQVLSVEQRFVVRTLALGEVHAAGYLSTCSDSSAAEFLGVAATLPPLFPDQVTAVLSETNPHVVTGASLFVDEAYIRRLLMRAIVPERMKHVLALMEGWCPEPLCGVFSITSDVLAARLRREPAEVAAVVLRTLMSSAQRKSGAQDQSGPQKAARLFTLLPPTLRPAVVERILHPREHNLRVIRLVESALLPSMQASTALAPSTHTLSSLTLPADDSRAHGLFAGQSERESGMDTREEVRAATCADANMQTTTDSTGQLHQESSLRNHSESMDAESTYGDDTILSPEQSLDPESPTGKAAFLLAHLDGAQRATLLRIMEETGVPEAEVLRR